MSGLFRLVQAIAVATFLTSFAITLSAQTSVPQWSFRARSNDIMYFAFATPARLERYDLAQEKWLESVALTSTPTALHVDEAGIYLAYGRSVVRRSLDGTGEQQFFNSAADINGLLTDGSFLFVFAPNSGQSNVTSLRKSDGQLVSSWSTYYSLSAGYSIAPNSRRIYGVNTYTSSFSTIELSYTATGTFGTVAEKWSDTGSFYENSRTFVFPNESAVVRHNGIVYNTPGLTYRASLAGAFDDAAFHGSDVLIVLRGNTIYAYANTLLEAGRYTLSAAAKSVAVRNGQVYAFSTDGTIPSGIAATKVPVTSITSVQPGAPIDPVALKLIPDDVIAAGDGTFFFFSTRYQSIFRWSAVEKRFTASLPLATAPRMIAYSATLNRLYLGYTSGQINQIKLDAGKTTEEPFANLPMAVLGLQTAGNLIFAVDESGAWVTHYVFGSDGSPKAAVEWNYYSREYIWSPVQRRMYFFRDDTSPNDLHYETIGTDGKITGAGETPYHGDYNFVHPIRVANDETGVLIGSGIVFSATGLTYAGSLGSSITDAASRDNRWISVRPSGTDTQLQTWTANLLFDRGFTVPGAPLRVFPLSDGKILVLTTALERTVFSLVDLTGAGSVSTSPMITVEPVNVSAYTGRAATLGVTAQGSGLTYQWNRNGVAIAGATNSTLAFSAVQAGNAGTYTVAVSNSLGVVTSATVTLTVQDPPPPPVIATQPADQVVPVGGTISLSVSATGTGPFTYQWRKDGAPISGAISSTYSKSNITTSDTGEYVVAVTNDGGTTTSRTAVVSLPVRVASLLSRLQLDGRGAVATLYIEGSGSRTVLLRVLGPALQTLGVSGAAADPKLELFGSTGSLLGANDNWGAGDATALAAMAQQVGATPLAAGSKDAALIASVPAGVNTIRISLASGTAGPALFELFDANASVLPRIAYVGTRAPVASGNDVLIGAVGFSGAGTKSLLVRALGPALADDNALGDPVLTWSRAGSVLASNDDWGTSVDAGQLATLAARFGALALAPGSRDAALIVGPSVLAGGYTAQVSASAGTSGWATLEFIDTDAARPTSQPPVLVVAPASQSTVSGRDVVFSVRAAGTAPFTYLWRKNGTQVLGAVDPAILLRAVQPADAGSYTVTVTNSAGSTTSLGAVLTVDGAPPPPPVPTATHAAGLYEAGSTLAVANTLAFPGTPAALGWSVTIPSGWSYAGGSNEPDVRPLAGATGTLEWAWSSVPASPVTFTYLLNVPAGETAARTLVAQAFVRQNSMEQGVAVTPNPLVVASARWFHTADMDRDSKLSLFELVRFIELYNARSGSTRTGQYRESPGSEDGFAPDTSAVPPVLVRFHAGDTNRDGRISLFELTRVIELYNTRAGTVRTGAYHSDMTGEDGFAPGP